MSQESFVGTILASLKSSASSGTEGQRGLSRAVSETLAKGGVDLSMFFGRAVEAARGRPKKNLNVPYGFRQFFSGGTVFKPGALSPRTTRINESPTAQTSVGTTTVLGGLDYMNDRNARFGVAGSRAPYGRHAPRKVDAARRVSLLGTPAYGVLQTAYARTGIPVLYSKFAAPNGQRPNGMGRWDPLLDATPGYTRVPLGEIVPAPSPVGCLPGTPGCYSDPRTGDIGLRKSWRQTQYEGRMSSPILPAEDGPLVVAPSDLSSPLSDPGYAAITLPVNHPGAQHVMDADGGDSYLPQPGYPNYVSPFGYAGSDRPAAQQPVPSGQDAPFRRMAARGERTRALAIGAAAVIGYMILRRRGR